MLMDMLTSGRQDERHDVKILKTFFLKMLKINVSENYIIHMTTSVW
jgi:hypothetical protein